MPRIDQPFVVGSDHDHIRTPTSSASAPDFRIAVRNLARGQTIELGVTGPIGSPELAELGTRMERLIAVRQPATLCVDLTESSVRDPGTTMVLLASADALAAIGSTLVVRSSDAALGAELRRQASGRPLAVEA